jgi:ribonuclease HI
MQQRFIGILGSLWAQCFDRLVLENNELLRERAQMRVATDGSCLKNPGGKTGWAWVAEDGRWKSGSVAAGSNNIAELMAALAALRAHRTVEQLHLMIDSQYVLNIIQKWGAGWRRRGWKKADGSPVANAKLVEKLLDEAARPGLTFEWVKGHNGHSKGRYDPQVIADAFSSSGNKAAAAARKRTNRSVGTPAGGSKPRSPRKPRPKKD